MCFLTNFQPALLPLSTDTDHDDEEIDSYFTQLSDSEVSDSDEDVDSLDKQS